MEMREIFRRFTTIAVVGMSTDPGKPSHGVPLFMLEQGYTVIPVHLTADIIAGQKVYKDLMDIPEEIDILNIFRPSAECADHVRRAVERRQKRGDIKLIWLQERIVSDEAREIAEKAGIDYIEDKCMYKEYIIS